MKSNLTYKFESFGHAMDIAVEAERSGDIDLSSAAFAASMNHLTPEMAEYVMELFIDGMGYMRSMKMWTWFVQNGLDMSDHPSVQEAYRVLSLYVLKNAPPEIKAVFEEGLNKFCPELSAIDPAGYDEEGNPWFSVSEVCESLGIDEEEALEYLEGTGECRQQSGDLHKIH